MWTRWGGRGSKNVWFCPHSGYRNCPRRVVGGQKWQNSVHIVVEWPLIVQICIVLYCICWMNCKGSKGRSSGKVTTERKYCSLFILSYLFFSWLLKTFQQHMLIHNCVIFYWFFFRQLQELKNIILCKNSIQNQVVSTSKSGGKYTVNIYRILIGIV